MGVETIVLSHSMVDFHAGRYKCRVLRLEALSVRLKGRRRVKRRRRLYGHRFLRRPFGGAGRRHARIIGYSYAYEEPWTTAGMGKDDKGKGRR